jgi:L-2-hydroxyglutarate oxidase LhgO
MDIHRSRVLVVGAGIAGLTIGYRLAQYGLFPVVVESGKQIASGSTTRNEGWLHAGTFHSQSIKDPHQAIRVAQRCMYGHEQFKRFCSDAIEDPIAPTIAVTLCRDRIPEISERWAAANITHREISKRELIYRAPSIQIENIEAAWEVREVSINTRLLCHRLACAIEAMGGNVICDVRIERLDVGDTQIRLGNDLITITPSHAILEKPSPLIPSHSWAKHLRH